MIQQLWAFFTAFFANPSVMGIGLAFIFGAIWLACYRPPLLKEHWLWAVLIASAIITPVAISFIQIPLQELAGQILGIFWSQEILIRWIFLAVIPAMLLSGLIQEMAKLVPVIVYWWRKGKDIDPRLGLLVGAVAGAGFGIFEAQWMLNSIFASGWSWEAVQTNGLVSLTGFWERFFILAFHTASTALAGYGLAKGKGWRFYLMVSLVHAFLNYSAVFAQTGLGTLIQMEIFIAVVSVLTAGVALWLRWKYLADQTLPEAGKEQQT